MADTYGLVANTLPRVFNPPPGWDEALVSWQAKNVGWVPPTADWTPDSVPGALPAPVGWQFWVPNPILIGQLRSQLVKKSLIVIAVGFALLVAGFTATIIGESLASAGGSFIIFTGLMIVGFARIIFGVIRLIRAPSMARKLFTASLKH